MVLILAPQFLDIFMCTLLAHLMADTNEKGRNLSVIFDSGGGGGGSSNGDGGNI